MASIAGLGLTEDSCLPSGLPSALGQTRVLRVLSVPLVSGSPVGKEVEAGEGMGQLRAADATATCLMLLKDA